MQNATCWEEEVCVVCSLFVEAFKFNSVHCSCSVITQNISMATARTKTQRSSEQAFRRDKTKHQQTRTRSASRLASSDEF